MINLVDVIVCKIAGASLFYSISCVDYGEDWIISMFCEEKRP